MATVDTRKARLYFSDGQVIHYEDQNLAFVVWLSVPRSVCAAFRGANDTRPVYPGDRVGAPPVKRPRARR
jgi:hypothetical protein